jgi:hypothetical protein
MATNSNVFDFIVGQSDFATVDMIKNLDRSLNAQVISSAVWEVENTGVATYVNSSSAVDAGGRYISAKFTAAADGVTRVKVTATTTSPTATIVEYILLRVYTPPSSL